MRKTYTLSCALCLSFLLSFAPSQCLDISWAAPIDGDVYEPASFIVGRWGSGTEIASPSFRLCSLDDSASGDDGNIGGDDDDPCGEGVQPTIQQDPESGLYQTTLYVCINLSR